MPLRTIPAEIWKFLHDSHDQIDAVAQVVLALAVILAVIDFKSKQEEHTEQSQQTTVKIWDENVDVYTAIDREWHSYASNITRRLDKPPAVDDVYKISLPPQLRDRANYLPIRLNDCVSTKECDEKIAISKFCFTMYEWGLLISSEHYTFGQFSSAVAERRKSGDLSPESVFLSYNNNTARPEWILDEARLSLAGFIKTCNADTDQKRLYNFSFSTAYGDKIVDVDASNIVALPTTHLNDFAPSR